MIQYAATDIRSFLVDSWSKCHLKWCTFSCIANCKAVSVSHTQCVLDLWPFNVWKICLQWCSVMYCGFKCYLTLLNPTCSSIMHGNKSKDSIPVSFFSSSNYLILTIISCVASHPTPLSSSPTLLSDTTLSYFKLFVCKLVLSSFLFHTKDLTFYFIKFCTI